ncbi:MAG: sigma-70 family RNA polymerase sigma factor [bacterium]|nr:sigma-70 family RNA polymerase sigma factor [bacterium]
MWLFNRNKSTNDEDLAKLYFTSGNKRFVGELFEKHVQTVFGVCLFYLRNKEAAKDAVMQIFEKLLLELKKNEVRNFRAWLSFVVRNHCLSIIRGNRNKYFLPEEYLDFEVTDATLEEEEKISGVNEETLLEHLKEVLPLLKDTQRICIELFYLKGNSYEDIKKRTGYDLNQIKSFIQNGKRNLKLMIVSRTNTTNNEA